MGLVFVIETLSVIVQVASFRITGRRVFRMAPIHHHFELKGWPETTVIIRFWMITGACTALGLGLFYREFIRAGGPRVIPPDRDPGLAEQRFLVYGLGVTNRAVVAALVAHGLEVRLAGDGDEGELREFAASVAVHEVVHAPDRGHARRARRALRRRAAGSRAARPTPASSPRSPTSAVRC